MLPTSTKYSPLPTLFCDWLFHPVLSLPTCLTAEEVVRISIVFISNLFLLSASGTSSGATKKTVGSNSRDSWSVWAHFVTLGWISSTGWTLWGSGHCQMKDGERPLYGWMGSKIMDYQMSSAATDGWWGSEYTCISRRPCLSGPAGWKWMHRFTLERILLRAAAIRRNQSLLK